MKQEHFEYVWSNWEDPPPLKKLLCHEDMITCLITIAPDQDANKKFWSKDNQNKEITIEEKWRKLWYATASRDGTIKIWSATALNVV